MSNYSTSFLNKIDLSIKNIMKDGKIDAKDIPEIILLVSTLINESKQKMTMEKLANSINDLYNYIMVHYNLYPNDPVKKTEFQQLFNLCIKLVLFQPKIEQKCESLFSCLGCK